MCSHQLPCYSISLREEDSQYDKNRSLMINITSELQILNQEHWESDFDQIEWTYLSILVNPNIFFLESVLMLELYNYADFIPSVLQLIILLMNLRCRHDITMILRRLCTLSTQSSLKRSLDHSCMSRKPSKPL